jgi:NICE-3 protein
MHLYVQGYVTGTRSGPDVRIRTRNKDIGIKNYVICFYQEFIRCDYRYYWSSSKTLSFGLWLAAGIRDFCIPVTFEFFLYVCPSAGPLVGLEPKKIHRFCDLYEHARHSYRPFKGPELAKYLQHLSELKLQVSYTVSVSEQISAVPAPYLWTCLWFVSEYMTFGKIYLIRP